MRRIRSYTKPQQKSVQQVAKITRLCIRDSNAILLVFNLLHASPNVVLRTLHLKVAR